MLRQIQRIIREGRYRATWHIINISLPDDDCDINDAVNAILSGKLTDVFDNDDGGERYEITGPTLAHYEMAVVCRVESNTVILITSYVL